MTRDPLDGQEPTEEELREAEALREWTEGRGPAPRDASVGALLQASEPAAPWREERAADLWARARPPEPRRTAPRWPWWVLAPAGLAAALALVFWYPNETWAPPAIDAKWATTQLAAAGGTEEAWEDLRRAASSRREALLR